MALKGLTVSFGSIFQTEGDGEHGVILKELCGERVPPEIVAVLGGAVVRAQHVPTHLEHLKWRHLVSEPSFCQVKKNKKKTI